MSQRVQAVLAGSSSAGPVVEIERTKTHIRVIYEIRVIVCMLCQKVVACTMPPELGEYERCSARAERYLNEQVSAS